MSTKKFEKYKSTAEAAAKLLNPLVEIVIHNLETNTIEAIYNNFSNRKIGDDSNFEVAEIDNLSAVIGPYQKTNWDGRKLKCTTAVLYDDDGKAFGTICMNMDVSQFELLGNFAENMMRLNENITAPDRRIFESNLDEQINVFVKEYTDQNKKALITLSKEDKKQIVKDLQLKGAFEQKNAADYIAKILSISRATVYNYLKD
ncbi:MAG: hypothetical protein CMH30_02075 [Micavibrio sp.]|nr:hypothetical protein [Micavibrio sp.]|tara:strand:- start:189 stop:794 length:606 start_codon:yes stop_codon:yes gene_type:complete